MLISMRYDFVFLCTPKCASTSVEAMLYPYSDIRLQGPNYLKHTNVREFETYIRPFLAAKTTVETLETICVVREPVSWLDSWYRFRARHRLRDPDHPSHDRSTADIAFPDFVRAYMSSPPPRFAANIDSQFDFVKDGADEVGVQTIFRYERVEDLVAYMSRKVDASLTLPRRNVSPAKNHRSNLPERIGFAKRKIRTRLRRHRDIPITAVPTLPDELMSSIRDFMRRDFELYESVRSSCPPPIAEVHETRGLETPGSEGPGHAFVYGNRSRGDM